MAKTIEKDLQDIFAKLEVLEAENAKLKQTEELVVDGYLRYRKVGTDVELFVTCWDEMTLIAWEMHQLGTLNDKYKSKVNVVVPLAAKIGGTVSNVMLNIQADGRVFIQNITNNTITANPIQGFVKYSTL